MKKYVFAAIAVIAVLSVTLCLNAQPAGGGMGMGGGMGGFGAGGGGGMMGGMGGMRGTRGPVERPDKEARLALIKELEAQVKTLVAAVEAAPAKDTEVTADSDQATIDKATAERQAETDALAAVQTTLASLRNSAASAAGARGGRGGMGASADVLSELRVIANGEKATKTVAKLDALIKEAQTTGGRGNRQGRGQGGGMMGGGMMGGGAGAGMMGGGRGGRGGAGGN